jgi:hypothetical protein
VSTLLSDELLSELMAVGQVDALVGLPTLNHSDSVGPVVRAVHVAFNRELARERTALVNVDGGSTDGTPDIVRDASIVDRETLVASQSLRTRHRISGPYHGVPGKVAALRTIFAAADLLQARAVVVLDPEIASVTPESVAALARPVLRGEADFVSPVYARHPLDGALVTQVVRPLFGAAYGLVLQEPLAGEFGCSGLFAARCLDEPNWDSDDLRLAIDLWISGVGAQDGLRAVEVPLGPRRLTSRPRPGVAALVPQVLDALFTCLRLQEQAWTTASRQGTPPRMASPPDALEPPPTVDAEGFEVLFREGFSALGGMLQPVLRAPTLEGLRAATGTDRPLEISDALWASVVVELAAAHRHAAISRDHLVRAAVPLYLGRVASFAAEVSGLPAGSAAARLEALCLHFERCRGDLLALWTAPAR